MRFRVIGEPITQGSKTPFKLPNGRVVVVEKRHGPLQAWRFAVAEAAKDTWKDRPLIDGPVELEVYFYIAKPASEPKRRRTYPIKARSGDVDKLARAVLDALTGVIFKDDSQVRTLIVSKDWADAEPPGCEVYLVVNGEGRIPA